MGRDRPQLVIDDVRSYLAKANPLTARHNLEYYYSQGQVAPEQAKLCASSWHSRGSHFLRALPFVVPAVFGFHLAYGSYLLDAAARAISTWSLLSLGNLLLVIYTTRILWKYSPYNDISDMPWRRFLSIVRSLTLPLSIYLIYLVW